MLAQLMTTVPILEVFVHEVEAAGDDARLVAICEDRCAKHACTQCHTHERVA